MFSFDARPVSFYCIAGALLLVFGLVAIWPTLTTQKTGRINQVLFIGIAALALQFSRAPVVLFNQELNPDESQLITQALTLTYDPIYWRSVDGTTGGPLDSYLLILPSWLGRPFDYVTARLTGLLMVVLAVWFIYQAARAWFGELVARLATVPPLVLLALTQHHDLVHYSSEHLPMAMLGGSYYLLARLQRDPALIRWRLFVLGLLVGMIPFGKLQGLPMAGCVFLFALLEVGTRPYLSFNQRMSRFGWLVAGGLSFPLLVVLLTVSWGVFGDMMLFYVIGNLKYGAGSPLQWLTNMADLPNFFRQVQEYGWFMGLIGACCLLYALAGLLSGFRPRQPVLTWAFLVSLLVATFLAITRTGSQYTHYLLFLVAPASLLGAWCLWETIERLGLGLLARVIALSILAGTLLPFGIRYLVRYQQGLPMNQYVQNTRVMHKSDVTRLILEYARPGEPLAVWGWMCRYYVEAQMPQAVSENRTIRSVFNHSMREVYRRRYLADLMRSRPPVFVDAVGNSLWLNDRPTQAHESFPELKTFVMANYILAGERTNTRVYIRNDRYRAVSRPIVSL